MSTSSGSNQRDGGQVCSSRNMRRVKANLRLGGSAFNSFKTTFILHGNAISNFPAQARA